MTDDTPETDDAETKRLKKQFRSLVRGPILGMLCGLSCAPLYYLLALAEARLGARLVRFALGPLTVLTVLGGLVVAFPSVLRITGRRRLPRFFLAADLWMCVVGALVLAGAACGLFYHMRLAAGLLAAPAPISLAVGWWLGGIDLGPWNRPAPPLLRAAALLMFVSVPAFCWLGTFEDARLLPARTAQMLLVGVGVVGFLSILEFILYIRHQLRSRVLPAEDDRDA